MLRIGRTVPLTTFVPRADWACVIFNLHVDHTDAAKARAAADFRRLVDRVMRRGGSYYLTYHRWAIRGQVLACHPAFEEFLRAKRAHGPDELFKSDGYRHYAEMFGMRGTRNAMPLLRQPSQVLPHRRVG